MPHGPRIGVLALQGGFARHLGMLARVGASACEIRDLTDLEQIEGLILPGGESTTMGKLLVRSGLMEAIRTRIAEGFPVWGTCAGTILLADRIKGYDQPHLGGLPVMVERNSYGRQVESFEMDLETTVLDGPVLRAVFIRAPRIIDYSPEVSVLARCEESPVLVRAGNLLASTFHPELTDDARLHQYFCAMVNQSTGNTVSPAAKRQTQASR